MITPYDDLIAVLESRFPQRRHPLREWWITLRNTIWFRVTSGPAYAIYRTNRPSLWRRLTVRPR